MKTVLYHLAKKDVKTVKKLKKQKRYLNDTLKNLHQKFIENHSKISFSFFCKLRPFYVVRPVVNARDTCMCIKHANINFIVSKLRILKLTSLDLKGIIREITCGGYKAENCMLRKCMFCKSKKIPISEFIENQETFYYKWLVKQEERTNKKGKQVKVQIYCKEKILSDITSLINTANREIQPILTHSYTIYHQQKYIQLVKDNLSEREGVLIIDFSENFLCKYNQEVQSFHFGASRMQLTLHTSVLYYKSHDSNDLQHQSYTSVSEDPRHNSSAVWAHLQPVIEKVKAKNINRLYIFSDGPTSQYKNKFNLFLICKLSLQNNFETLTWNFWESGHGKGPADGIGAALKRKADDYVAKSQDISDAKTFMTAISDSKIEIFAVTSEQISNIEKLIPDNLVKVPGTQKIHQVTWIKKFPFELGLKTLSCSCSPSLRCNHYKLRPNGFINFSNFFNYNQPSKSRNQIVENIEDNCTNVNSKKYEEDAMKTDGEYHLNIEKNDWVAVLFEDSWYPGIVKDLKKGKRSNELVVSFMKKTKGLFSWPVKEDVQTILSDEIICKIKAPQMTMKNNNLFKVGDVNKIERIIGHNN